MKKTVSILLAMLLLCTILTGCGAASGEAQALEKLLAANTPEALLADHGSILLSYTLADGSSFSIFVDPETYLYADNTGSFATLFSPREQCEVWTENGITTFDRYINPFRADLGAVLREQAILLEVSAKETVTSLSQKDDLLYLETSLAASDLTPEEMEHMDIHLETGDQYICQYTAEAGNYRVLGTEEYILRSDGSREDIGNVTIQINAEAPALIAQLEARGAEIDAMPPETVRTITCIVDPGLDTEYTTTKTVEKDSYVLFPEGIEGYQLYLDAEGTQPFAGTPEADSSVTVYLIKK